MKIRTWDKVEIMQGKDKDRGQRSEVLKVFTETNKVLVKDVNVVTRHLKKQWTNPGQIVKMEKSIDASNVMLICPFTDKPTRVGFVMLEEKWKNKKFRYSKRAANDKNEDPKKYIIK